MPAGAISHQHRHFKTLIVLVLAMTSGTVLLFWVAQIAPITPLRGKTAATAAWTQIAVRAQPAEVSHGFYHYRIDATGRLFQSRAWLEGRHDRSTPGAVHVLLTCPDRSLRVSAAQGETLSRIIAELRGKHTIPEARVSVEGAQGAADRSQAPRRHLLRT